LKADGMVTDKDQALAKVDALFSAWEFATNSDDPKWRRQWAEACIAAGLPCVETRQNERGEFFQIDAGADGWRAWATKR
jgi:hypothetical protein